MATVREHGLHLTILFWFATLYMTSCASDSYGTEKAFAADMQVRIDNVNTSTRLWARDGKLRLALSSGRSASTLLADYRCGKCWALFPAQATYQEISASSLRDNIPHFFDPATKVDKQPIGFEALDGVIVRIYKAVVHSRGGRRWEGTLWESEELQGFPLKWSDAHRDIEAHWSNAAWVEVSDDFFAIPEHYHAQEHAPRQAPSLPKSVKGPPVAAATM